VHLLLLLLLLLQISTLAALAYHKSTGRTAARPNQRMGFAGEQQHCTAASD
jgi:hypothetical protein